MGFLDSRKDETMNLLQQRIEELGSAILNRKGDRVHIIGFYNRERLMDYLNGINCFKSKGLYDEADLDYSRIQDNCLMILMEDDIEVKRIQYIPIFNGIVKFNTLGRKTVTRMFSLRRCLYSDQYNIIILDENNEKQSFIYNDIQDVGLDFDKMFFNYKLYGLDNKRIKEGFDYVKGYDTNRH